MQVERVPHDVVVVTLLDAELRSDNVETLRPALLSLVDDGDLRMVLNLGHVTFLESMALGLIVQLGSKLSHLGGWLHLCGVQPEMRRLFIGPPLLPIGFPLFADVSDAVAAASGGMH